jgi:hypothetical protein
LGAAHVCAKPLGQATVTEVNNDVRYQPTGNAERKAKRQDVVRGADVVRTGPKSQAELEFEDRTITRIGSNSIFTFDPEKRQFELKKGLLLFDMPKNAGGGRIVTPAGTAAIEGTAGIVSYRSPLKVICLAGQINLLNPQGGIMAQLLPGQMFIQGITPKPVDIKLKGLNGKLFAGGLPNNQGDMNNAADQQMQQINSGVLAETPFMMIGEGTDVLLVQNLNLNTPIQQLQNLINPNPPQTPTFTVGSSDTVNFSTAQVIDTASGTVRKQGTMNGDVAQFTFENENVLFTGDPTAVTDGGADGKFTLATQGDFTISNFGGENGEDNQPDVTQIAVTAKNITVQNSDFGADASYQTGEPGQLSLMATDSLVVDPSWLHATGYDYTEGEGGGYYYDGGVINLQSAGITSVQGLAIPNLTQVDVTGVNGGTVNIVSTGERPGDMVFIKNTLIDASEYSGEGIGGQVNVLSKLLVRIEGTTGIVANGVEPGHINVEAFGTSTDWGTVWLDASDGPIGFEANSGSGLPEIPPPAGNIGINGGFGGSGKTITFGAYGFDDEAGGDILLSGSQVIAVRNAYFDVAGGSLDAGVFWIGNYNSALQDIGPAMEVALEGVDVDAFSSDAKGGEVKIIGANSVWIGSDTHIRADGGSEAGSITIQSPGIVAGTGGQVVIETSAEGNPIDLSAQSGVGGPVGFAALEGPSVPNINISGEAAATPPERTIELTAVNPGAGGLVRLSTPANVNVFGAAIKVGGEGSVLIGDWVDSELGYELAPAQSVNIGGTIIQGNSSGGSGSQLAVMAKDVVNISGGTSPSTDIQMNGAAGAGDIHVDATGDSLSDPETAGQVNITAGADGYVRLSAQQTAAVLAALPNGNVDIVGVDKGDGNKSINIVAASPMTSGQQINIQAIDAIRVQHAKLIADGYMQGGQIILAANNITLNNAFLSASATGSYGYGGAINLNGGQFGIVSLTDSALLATGNMMGGSIYIRGGTINFASANTLNAGVGGSVYLYGTVSGTPTVTGNLITGPYQAP